jgi:hypothetical protein
VTASNKRFKTLFLAGVLMTGTVAALSSVNVVRASVRMLPDTACHSFNPCRTFSNSSTGAGVAGTNSSSGPGVAATATGQGPGVNASAVYDGIDAYSSALNGGYFNGGYQGVYAVGSTSTAFPLYAVNSYTGGFMEVDNLGDVYASGSMIGGAMKVHHGGGIQQVATYSTESAQSTLEDVGTGQMIGGRGTVRIDPTFGSMIDAANYHVFLTAKGDNRGLYIATESARGFEVRESQGGHATLAFDYRIVAQPIDEQRSRLPAITVERRPVHPPSFRR